MKTIELTGALLAQWVARANGWRVEPEDSPENPGLICWDHNGEPHSFSEFGYRPDMRWAQGGPIIDNPNSPIERFEHCSNDHDYAWVVTLEEQGGAYWGSTLLEAAMRAFVASVYGHTVPDEVAP